jgi:hypothetical protein
MAKKKLPPLCFLSGGNIQFFELLETLNPNFQPHILSCGAGIVKNSITTNALATYIVKHLPLVNP